MWSVGDHRRRRLETGNRPARRLDDLGGTLVEFALVAPLLFLLLFAIADFGIAYNDAQAVRQASRDGARAVSTNGMATNASCSPTPVVSGDLLSAVCFTKERTSSLTGSDARVKVALKTTGTCANGDAASASAPCTGKGDPVAVCVQYPLQSVSGMFSALLDGKYLTSEVVMRIEKPLTFTPSGGSYAEAGGGPWTWCSNPT